MRLDLRRNQRKQFCFCSKSCPADVSWRLSESDLFCLLFNQSQMLLLAPELRLGPRVIMNVLFILSLSSSGFLSTVKILSSLQLLLSAVYFQASVYCSATVCLLSSYCLVSTVQPDWSKLNFMTENNMFNVFCLCILTITICYCIPSQPSSTRERLLSCGQFLVIFQENHSL